MTAIHVVVRSRPERSRNAELSPSQGHFDVVIDGINITARVGEGQALSVLAELGTTLAELLSGRRSRSVVQLHSKEDPWELGLEIDGRHALLTVFKAGAAPEVAVAERPVELSSLKQGVLDAILTAQSGSVSRPLRSALDLARQLLQSVPASTLPNRSNCEVNVTPKAIRGFAFRADAKLRANKGSNASSGNPIERSDLHALLFLGSFGVNARGRSQSVAGVPLFLVADRLVELAHEALDARLQSKPLFRRHQLGAVRLGVRLAPVDAPLAFSLGSADAPSGTGLTFPELDPVVFAQSVVLYVRSLRDAIIAADPNQAFNLRLTDLTNAANALLELTRISDVEQSMTNPRADEYRGFVPARSDAEAVGRWDAGVPMRFSMRWSATVPNIDLKSVLLAGEHFLVGAARETACLERHTGNVIWRHALPRAGTLVIPDGFVRLHPDGKISAHDIETGEQRFSARLTPRAAGGAAGAVVLAPGLPKIIAVAEGDRRITALDLASGEIRWRYTARRPSPFRVRRAGRLVLVCGGDTVMTALDVSTGDTIWRAADRLPFTGDVAVDDDEAIAVSAGAQGVGALHCYDACSGELRWTSSIDDRPLQGQVPLLTRSVVLIVVRDARGCGARAYDRRSGAEIWNIDPGQLPRTAGWVAIDDFFVANGSDATLTAIEASTGALRYRHVMTRPMDPDVPRQLQPTLRNGALYVPQQRLVVVRPRDGQMLGTLPTDLLPDVVRVDDTSTVYIAEESGHVAAFSSAPMLVRVK
jgi:outer membrane protein assembly factor BamB